MNATSTSSGTAPAPSPASPTYTRATRLFHAALATTILVQLGSSLGMVTPFRGRTENLLFEVHEYSGLAALVLAGGFWLVVVRRRLGTPLVRLFPWFSAPHRRETMADLGEHVDALRARRVPEVGDPQPLASAIHGLGLALITAMALSGTLIYLAILAGAAESGWGHLVMDGHGLLSKLVWAYLIGHAGMALINHFLHRRTLGTMWDLGAGRREG